MLSAQLRKAGHYTLIENHDDDMLLPLIVLTALIPIGIPLAMFWKLVFKKKDLQTSQSQKCLKRGVHHRPGFCEFTFL